MKNILYRDLAKEVLSVIPYLDNEFVNNLPSNLLATLTDLAADSTENFYIQKSKKLEEQNLSEDCKNLLSILYYEFATESDKAEVVNAWFQNDYTE